MNTAMKYEKIVEKLIEKGLVPEKKMRRGVYGFAQFEYYDKEYNVILVAYYNDDGELVTQTEYDMQDIMDMCEQLD